MVTSFVPDAVLWPADVLTSRFWRVRAITKNRFIVAVKRQMWLEASISTELAKYPLSKSNSQ